MSDLPIFQRKADEEIAQLKQRIEQLERCLDIAEKHLHDEHFEWYAEETEQLRKEVSNENN